jgi:hypothetical protein
MGILGFYYINDRYQIKESYLEGFKMLLGDI